MLQLCAGLQVSISPPRRYEREERASGLYPLKSHVRWRIIRTLPVRTSKRLTSLKIRFHSSSDCETKMISSWMTQYHYHYQYHLWTT